MLGPSARVSTSSQTPEATEDSARGGDPIHRAWESPRCVAMPGHPRQPVLIPPLPALFVTAWCGHHVLRSQTHLPGGRCSWAWGGRHWVTLPLANSRRQARAHPETWKHGLGPPKGVPDSGTSTPAHPWAPVPAPENRPKGVRVPQECWLVSHLKIK